MDIKEYRKTMADFLSLSSKMLRSTSEMGNVQLIRFKKYIDENPIISNILKKKIENVTCEEGIIKSRNGYWCEINVPCDEAEQIKGIYDYLTEVTMEQIDLRGIAARFHTTSKRYDDIIQNYLKKVFKPLIDFIVDELRKEEMDIEMEQKGGITINIDKNLGTTNIGQGDIYSTNTVNEAAGNGQDMNEIINLLIQLINDLNIDNDTKEDVVDDLSIIQEQINLEQPKKVKLKKACDGLNKFINYIPKGIATATTIATNIGLLIEAVNKIHP